MALPNAARRRRPGGRCRGPEGALQCARLLTFQCQWTFFQTFFVLDSALIKTITLLFQCEAVCAMNTDTGSIRVSVQCSFTSTDHEDY